LTDQQPSNQKQRLKQINGQLNIGGGINSNYLLGWLIIIISEIVNLLLLNQLLLNHLFDKIIIIKIKQLLL